ncbi:hypothetical protein C6341_g7735 [Phytophthora cactorum]|uniref:Uncharacterized protein n=1 Tax=Phytophthora cactorum TaxID=29920 RepID=A0A8T1CBJ6_9STRA|nr:hypothetical protein PC117_g17372 [Phytophthora cactorum]KAG3178982.1 hypothetical protein C6341_g7735 [Phytophthora cactorum]
MKLNVAGTSIVIVVNALTVQTALQSPTLGGGETT